VYGWNYYPDDASDQPALEAHVARAVAFNQPYFPYVMAFNAGRNNPSLRTDPSWDADTRALMAYLKANAVSWTFWAYRPDFYAVGASSSLIDPATGAPKPDLLAALQAGF